MLRIVIDTNILFSALLNKESKISQIILNSKKHFTFYTPNFTLKELNTHHSKILKLTDYTKIQFDELLNLFMENIILIDEESIPINEYEIAYDLCNDIDEDDLFFVAAVNYYDFILWTGDKKLMSGLKLKGFLKLIDTNELYDIFIN